MKYRPHYLKKKKRHELNEFSIKGGRIAINGKLLDGVTSYNMTSSNLVVVGSIPTRSVF